MKFLIFFLSFSAYAVTADQITEHRYCGTPVRDNTGVIARSEKVKNEFRMEVPCPSTGKATGACPGWAIDHVWPLASCGCDSVSNMQWLPNTIKSCAGTDCKDRFERKVYKCK